MPYNKSKSKKAPAKKPNDNMMMKKKEMMMKDKGMKGKMKK